MVSWKHVGLESPKMSFYDSRKWWQSFSSFSCDNIIIKSSLSEKILGLTIDNNLDFTDHISNMRKTANQKPNALFTVLANMNSDKCTEERGRVYTKRTIHNKMDDIEVHIINTIKDIRSNSKRRDVESIFISSKNASNYTVSDIGKVLDYLKSKGKVENKPKKKGMDSFFVVLDQYV